jgi:hypothetical protein
MRRTPESHGIAPANMTTRFETGNQEVDKINLYFRPKAVVQAQD